MSGTCACGARWGGLRTAHCASCHLTFSGISTFDAHKPGDCRNPAQCGMVVLRISGTTKIWGHPFTGDAWWKSHREETR